MAEIFTLRHEVFVVEQKVPQELEIDEYDEAAIHLAAVSDGIVVGTLRMVGEAPVIKIGRMAVARDKRRNGIGTDLMKFAACAASKRGVTIIALDAQLTARDFYKQLGYVEEGEVFDDANIPHIRMKKALVARPAS